MAFPFFGKKKLPPPPIPAKKAKKSKKKLRAVKKIQKAKIKKAAVRVVPDFLSTVKSLKNLQASLNSAHKRISEVQSKSESLKKDFADFNLRSKKETEKSHKKYSEDIWQVRDSISEIKDSIENLKRTERKDIYALRSEQDSKFSKINQTISELKKTDSSLKGLAEILHSDLQKLQSNVKEVVGTFTPDAMKRLRSSTEVTKDFVKKLDQKENDLLKEVARVAKKLSSIEQHAATLESENLKTQNTAEELRKISDELSTNLQSAKAEIMDMKTRFNVAINSVSDLEKDKDAVHHRLSNVEGKLNSLLELRTSLAQISAVISELQRKVEAIERTAVKTFVIQ